MADPFESQLESVIDDYDRALINGDFDINKTHALANLYSIKTSCLAAIERTVGRASVYYESATQLGEAHIIPQEDLEAVIGVVKSLLSAVRKDYLKSLEEIIHGDVFGDFLEMVHDRKIDIQWEKIFADAFRYIRVDFVLVEDAGFLVFLEYGAVGVNAPDLDCRIFLLQVPPGPGDGATGSNTDEKMINFSAGLFPNFRASLPEIFLRRVSARE